MSITIPIHFIILCYWRLLSAKNKILTISEHNFHKRFLITSSLSFSNTTHPLTQASDFKVVKRQLLQTNNRLDKEIKKETIDIFNKSPESTKSGDFPDTKPNLSHKSTGQNRLHTSLHLPHHHNRAKPNASHHSTANLNSTSTDPTTNTQSQQYANKNTTSTTKIHKNYDMSNIPNQVNINVILHMYLKQLNLNPDHLVEILKLPEKNQLEWILVQKNFNQFYQFLINIKNRNYQIYAHSFDIFEYKNILSEQLVSELFLDINSLENNRNFRTPSPNLDSPPALTDQVSGSVPKILAKKPGEILESDSESSCSSESSMPGVREKNLENRCWNFT